jgi:fibronectin type 3 domain-containing protein
MTWDVTRWYRYLLFRPRRRPRSARPTLQILEARLAPAVSVLTYHDDITRSGVNASETQLTPTNVTVNSFGKLYGVTLDGQVYAEPLVETGVTIASGPFTTNGSAGVHDVVFVATEHDSLYAIDASPVGGGVLWKRSFLDTSVAGNNTLGASAIRTLTPNDVGIDDLDPEIGITSTPVIDASSGTLYVVAKTKETINGTTHFVQRLHAINVADGTDRVAPYLIGDTTGDNTNNTSIYVYGTGDGAVTDPYNGTGNMLVQFNALRENQRVGLSLVNNTVYVAWSSHGDIGFYHGWVVAWDVSKLASNGLVVKGVFNTSPNDGLAGIWQGGGGLTFEPDGSAFYFETGNGSGGAPTIGANGFPTNDNYNEALVKLVADPTTSPTNQNGNGWGFKVVDYFIPYDVASLDGADSDFGSGAPTLLPDSAGIAGHAHLIVVGGKEGKLYVLDRDHLGHYSANDDNALNSVPDGSGHNTPPVLVSGLLSTSSWFNGKLFVSSGYNDRAFTFILSQKGILSPASQTAVQSFGFEPGSPIISANGANNGIVWLLDRNANELHAYDATTLATELWNSSQKAGGADNLGAATKFAVPTEANGMVYVGTMTGLVVYGLAAPPNAVPDTPGLSATALSGSVINLTWTDDTQKPNTASGYTVQESTDGSTFNTVATTSAGANSLAVGGLAALTKYYFRISGFNSLGSSGLSNVASATTSNVVALLDFSGGFAGSTSDLTLNGSAAVNGNDLELTDGGGNEAGSAFSTSLVDVTRFTSQFTFQIPTGNNSADGFTFTIQGVGPTALGATGGDLGYGGIGNSVAIKFDLYNNAGEGTDSTGLYTDGAHPQNTGSIDLTSSGIDLHSGDVLSVSMSYDGNTLSVTITDTQTNKSATHDYTIDIPGTVGGNGAYVGFTAGTGGQTAIQNILTWTYAPNSTTSPNAPSGLGGTPASASSVSLTWMANATNQIGYHLDRATDADFTQNLITETLRGTLTSFTDTAAGLVPGQTYHYQLRAFNSAGDSGNSNPVTVTIPLAPPAPTNQQITNITTSEIDISWQDNAGHQALGYHILRATNHGSFTQVANLPPTSRKPPSTYTWSDTNLPSGTFFDYQIEAYNTSGNNGFAEVSAATLTDAPGSFTAAPGDGLVTLSWTAPTGAVTYNVYRATTAGGEGSTPFATGITGTSYTDTAVTIGTTFYYTLTAVNANAQGNPSLPSESAPTGESSSTPTSYPGAPTNVTATTANDTGIPHVNLSWTASTGATSYNLYRATSPGGEGAVPLASGISGTSFTDTNVGFGITYYYQITAVNGAGEGPRSTETSATPLFVVHVNFTSTSGDAVSGYLADTGMAFGSQGNGLRFGWSRSDTADGIDRNASSSPDELHDSFHEMHGLGPANVYWRIAVPNGTYSVHLIAGDPNDTSSVYRINVGNGPSGGVGAIKGKATAAQPWLEGTVTVTITHGFLYVTNGTGTQHDKVDEIDIVPLPPTIARFTPTGAAPGASVTLTGLNFSGATAVQFSGMDARFTVLSGSQIRAVVPAGALTGPITVVTPGGTATSASVFAVAPRIGRFTSTMGAPGDSVVITGVNFTGVTVVKFHGLVAAFTVNSPTQITATVPAGATTGLIGVASPAGAAASVGQFVVAPRITRFTPTGGSPGASVLLLGANFTGATMVRINGLDAAFTVLSATKIQLFVPTGAASGAISVATAAGTATTATSFVVAPRIDSFTPDSGSAGMQVSITGENFTGASVVEFGSIKATFTVDSATEITATVPTGFTSGRITVIAPGGKATSVHSFRRTG